MRIVLICNEYPPRPHAGIGTAIQAVARGLSARGHDIIVVGLGKEQEEHADGTIRVVTISSNDWPYFGGLISRLKLRNWLSNLLKTQTIDIIEVPETQGLLPFGLPGCTIVMRLHLSFSAVNKIPMARERVGLGTAFYEKQTALRIPNWIAVSNYVMDLSKEAFGTSPQRAKTIHNPVPTFPTNTPEISDLPARYILYAGHVSQRKGADILARAARPILEKHSDLHLVYAGAVFSKDGRPLSEDILSFLGPSLALRTHFLNRIERDKLKVVMQRAAVFAFPSHVEGFPMVILEALGCGIPVVYSKFPPGPEIIYDGITGLLADPSDADDFGRKISQILENPTLAAALSQSAKRDVEQRFSIENCALETEQFYASCLN